MVYSQTFCSEKLTGSANQKNVLHIVLNVNLFFNIFNKVLQNAIYAIAVFGTLANN